MLGKPSPSVSRRIVGHVVVVALALVCGYATWAAQPKEAPVGAVPAGRIQMKSVLRIDGGEPKVFTYVVAPGTSLTMLQQSQNGHVWSIDATVARGEDAQKGMLMVAATVRRDGKVVGRPKVGMQSGIPGVIKIGEEGPVTAFKGIEMEVTLIDGDAPVPAMAVANVDIAERLAPPAFPADALLKKLDGKVVLLVDYDATGTVTDVQVERSEPVGVFDAAAVEAARKWKFDPAADTNDTSVKRVRIPVTFEGSKQGAASATPKA